MELSIANHGAKKDLIIDQQKERHNGKASDKNSIKLIQESMTVMQLLSKSQREIKKKEIKEARLTQENERCRLSLKELEEKKYPFPDSDVPSMLEDLLQKNVIKLLECKRPEEMGRVNDPNYYHYH